MESCTCTDSTAQFAFLAISFISVLHWFYFLSGKLNIRSFDATGNSDSAFRKCDLCTEEYKMCSSIPLILSECF